MTPLKISNKVWNNAFDNAQVSGLYVRSVWTTGPWAYNVLFWNLQQGTTLSYYIDRALLLQDLNQ